MRSPRQSLEPIALILLLAGTALAMPAADPPPSISTVGIVRFRGSELPAQAANDQLREILTGYGYRVKTIEDFDDSRAAFELDPALDYIVRGLIADDSASALVFARGTATIRRLEGTGERAIRELVNKVLRHLASESAIDSIVQTRKALATEKLKDDPRDVDSLALLALAMRHEGRLPEAIQNLEQAIALSPRDPDLHYHLALCLATAGRREEQLASLQSALDIDPHHEAASIALANSHLEMGQTHEAIAVYRQMLDSPLHGSLARWNLAVAYLRLNDRQQALTFFKQIEPADRNYAEAQANILQLEVPAHPAAGPALVNQPSVLPPRALGFWIAGLVLVGVVLLAAGSLLVRFAGRMRKQSEPPSASQSSDTATQELHAAATPSAGSGSSSSNAGSATHAPLKSMRDYALLARLGAGGMGTVYRARHVHLDKLVALKVLRANLMYDDRAVERFRREMRAVGKLDHPNIVRATDAGECDGVHFLVMEYVFGIDLANLLQTRGQLAVADACELVRQAALGLQHAHEAGIIHRDIKPSNLMLSLGGTVKVMDLGLARLQELSPSSSGPAERELTGSLDRLGTPDYMSPEQASGAAQIDGRADIYGLGCTLYALLTGGAPFAHHTTAFSKTVAHVKEIVPPVEGARPDVGPALSAILAKMVAKSPADRYREPGEVATALSPFASGSQLQTLAASIPESHPMAVAAVDTLDYAKDRT